MAQTFFPLDPPIYNIQPTTAGAWTDVDVSAYIPSGATGVILHILNLSVNTAYALGLRKNGSSDDRYPTMSPSSHYWAAIGVDGSRIFEAYIGDAAKMYIDLIGYTMAGVTFLTNGVDKAASYGTWADMDCHVEAPNAIGLIFEIAPASAGMNTGLRNNGSSDNRINTIGYHNCFGAIIGCDTSQICECYRQGTFGHFWLVGYVTDGATFNTDATNVSLNTANAWIDLAALPANSVMGFIEVITTTVGYNYDLRKNGTVWSAGAQVYYHEWGIVECDASYIIEGRVNNLATDFFLVGVATKPAPPAVELGAFYQQLSPLGFNMYRAGQVRGG